MAVLLRITDFVPSTLIKSQEMDDELNQLVNILSGVSTNKDMLIKFSDAANPALRVDQLGAGQILQLLQNGAIKTAFDNSGYLYIGAGVTDAAPVNGIVNGTGGSGSNIAGAALDLAGGKGTGNADQGRVAVRFPLRAASGSTLQSLSTNRFPVNVNMYTNTTGATSLANSTAETSVFNGAGASLGATLTIQGGQSSPGTRYKGVIIAGYAATAGPTGRVKVKLGATTLADTGAVVIPNSGSGVIKIEFDIRVVTVGASGTCSIDSLRVDVSPASTGIGAVTSIFGVTNPIATVDFTANQAIDVTFQWGTANVSNVYNMVDAVIDIVR